MSQSTLKNIVTIGDGIAAWCLHEELLKLPNVHITNISSSTLFSPCSLSSTSLNCLRGTRRGLTSLGDLIVDSYELFEQFNTKFEPSGVYKGVEYQLWRQEQHEKWMRRYSNFSKTQDNPFLQDKLISKFNYQENLAYFIDPNSLKSWYWNRHQQISKISAFVSNIQKVKDKFLITADKDIALEFDSVILCTNQATHLLGRGFSEQFDYYLSHSKPVAGTYLEKKINSNEFTGNYNIAIGKQHLIVRSDSGRLQVGSTVDNNMSIDIPNKKDILNLYNNLQRCLSFELPSFDEFEMKVGIRHKGFERKPFWGKISNSDNIYSICGLYKNAFSFSYKAAQDIGSLLKASSPGHLNCK